MCSARKDPACIWLTTRSTGDPLSYEECNRTTGSNNAQHKQLHLLTPIGVEWTKVRSFADRDGRSRWRMTRISVCISLSFRVTEHGREAVVEFVDDLWGKDGRPSPRDTVS